MHVSLRASAMVALCAFAAPQAQAQIAPSYAVTRLPTAVGGTTRMAGGGGNSLNAVGQVGGIVSNAGPTRTAAISGPAGGGPATTLPTLPGLDDGAVYALSNDGRAVGEASLSRTGTRAVYWHDGTVREIGTFSTTPGYRFSDANDVNSAGRVVGSSYNPQLQSFQGFVTRPDAGALVGLTGLRADNASDAAAINDAGRIAGSARSADGTSRAVVWNPFGAAPDAAHGPAIRITGLEDVESWGEAMADGGAVAGTAVIDGARQGYYWAGAVGTTVNFIPPMNAYQTPDHAFVGTQVRGVNGGGLVVGSQYARLVGSSSAMQRAFVYDAASQSALLLDDLVPGWTFVTALGVNDSGLITAFGYSAESGYELESILLTPTIAAPVVTPEPATFGLLGAGLAAMGLAARRRRDVVT